MGVVITNQCLDSIHFHSATHHGLDPMVASNRMGRFSGEPLRLSRSAHVRPNRQTTAMSCNVTGIDIDP